MSEFIRLADASVCQGDLDAAAMKGAGLEGAYLRCSIGNEPGADIKFARNAKALVDAGLEAACYHFAYPLPHLDARAQAQHAFELATFGDHALGSSVGELPPALDLEWPPPETRLKDGTIEDTWKKWGCSGPQIRDWGLVYLDEASKLWGCKPIVYLYPYFAQRIAIASAAAYADYLLWIASYGAQGRLPREGERPSIPKPWDVSNPFLWQHDGNGGLKFPNGVDADFNVFVGGREAFDALRGIPRVPESVPAIDLTEMRAAARGIIVDDAIADYRANRQNEAA